LAFGFWQGLLSTHTALLCLAEVSIVAGESKDPTMFAWANSKLAELSETLAPPPDGPSSRFLSSLASRDEPSALACLSDPSFDVYAPLKPRGVCAVHVAACYESLNVTERAPPVQADSALPAMTVPAATRTSVDSAPPAASPPPASPAVVARPPSGRRRDVHAGEHSGQAGRDAGPAGLCGVDDRPPGGPSRRRPLERPAPPRRPPPRPGPVALWSFSPRPALGVLGLRPARRPEQLRRRPAGVAV